MILVGDITHLSLPIVILQWLVVSPEAEKEVSDQLRIGLKPRQLLLYIN
jgi:hypothetical protein